MAAPVALAFRIAANLDEFRANLAEMKSQLETTKASMQRMSSAFDGSKLISDANAALVTITKLGGASALTAKEQARANTILAEGIEKYKLLGRTAPAEMVKLEAATRQVTAVTQQAESRFGALSGVIGKFGPMLAATFSVGAITGGIRSLVTWADDLDEVSQGIGVGVEQLQKWQYAWATTGSSAEAGLKAIQTMTEKLADGSADETIARLGLSLSTIKQMKPEDQFTAMTDELAKVTDQSKFASDGADIFGKTWRSVGISVKNGMKEAADGAAALTEEQIKHIANLQAKWDSFLLWLKVSAGKVIGGSADPSSVAAQVARNNGETMWSQFWGTGGTLPKVGSPSAGSAISAERTGASVAEIKAIYAASDALSKHLTPAALKAADALKDLRVDALVASYKWQAGMEGEQARIAETARQAGSYFTGLPQGTFATDFLDTAPLQIQEWRELTIGASDSTWDWASSIRGLADSFVRLGAVVGEGGFKQAVQDVANIIGGTEMAEAGGLAIKGGGLGIISGSLQAASGFIQATKSTNRWANAAGGASSGAAMGSAFGPWGTAVGAIVGGIVGALRSTGPSKEQLANTAIDQSQQQLLSTYGTLDNIAKISGQLGVDLAGAWGSQGQAGLNQFKNLLDEFNAALEKDNKLIKDLAAMEPGQLLSKSVLAQIATGTLTDNSRAALGQFITGQTGTLMGTVQSYVEGGGNLSGAAGRGMFSAAMAGAGQMRQNGMSLSDIAAQMSPWLGGLSNATGMSNSFNDLLNTAARPEVGAILKSSDQIGTVATTMQNLGLLNKETFGDLTTGLSDAYQELLGQGVQGNDALRLMQPSLQQTYELVKDYGYAADEAMQTMLKAAEDQGIIGEAFRSSEDQLKASIDALIGSLNGLTATLGGQVPTLTSGSGSSATWAGGDRSGIVASGGGFARDDGEPFQVNVVVDGEVLVRSFVRTGQRKGLFQ